MAFVMVPPWHWLLRKARSGHELRFLPHGFPAAAHPGDHECLVEDFFSAANSVAFISKANDIVTKVFSDP